MSTRSHSCSNSAAVATATAAVVALRPKRAGFTLVELLLVAAILAILAAVAAPRYAASLTNYRVDAAARRIAGDIDAARTTARAQSRSVAITFGSDGYAISRMQGLDGASEFRINLREAPYSLRSFTYDFSGSDSISFDGYGAIDRGGTITLRVGDAARRVVIDSGTGTARIER